MSDDSPGGALPPRPREPGARFAEDESEIDESPSPAPSPSNPRRPSESTVMNRDVVLSVDDRVAAVKNHGRPGKVYKDKTSHVPRTWKAKDKLKNWGGDDEVEDSSVPMKVVPSLKDDPALDGYSEEIPSLNPRLSSPWAIVRKGFVRESMIGAFSGLGTAIRTNYGKVLAKATAEDVLEEEEKKHFRGYISPDSRFKANWDIWQILFLSYIAVVTPYRSAFGDPAYGFAFWIEFILDLYFIADLYINFMTGFWLDLEGNAVVLIDDRKAIAKRYLRGWFCLDAIACLPIDFVTRIVDGTIGCSFDPAGCGSEETNLKGNMLKMLKLLRIFRLLKLLKLVRITRLLVRYQDFLIYHHHFISLLKVYLLTLLICHWLGCIYGLSYSFDSVHKGTRWLQSMYWAVQSITSVGYGDMTSDNTSSLLIAILTMLVGVVVCSWIITAVITALSPDSSARRFQDRMHYVITYLKNNKLPQTVSKRVIHYYRWQNKNQFDEKAILHDLPAQLRKEIFDNMYNGWLDDIILFNGATSQFMNEVCLRISPVSFPQYQVVYSEGELGSEMYFITRGNAAVSLKDMPHFLSQEEIMDALDSCVEIGRGSFFGEAAALGYGTRLETIITTSSCTLLRLSEYDILELEDMNPGFRAELMLIAFERMRRNRLAREKVEDCMRELAINPADIVAGVEKCDAGGVHLLGRTTRVTYVQKWRQVVKDHEKAKRAMRARVKLGATTAASPGRTRNGGWEGSGARSGHDPDAVDVRGLTDRISALEHKIDRLIAYEHSKSI